MGRIKGKIVIFSLSVICFFTILFQSQAANASVYRKSETKEKKIALTFDDGPSKRNTEEILSILDEFGIKATFFVIGANAKADPERILSIHNAGHEIGNHTYTHAYITKISPDLLREEIKKTEDVLKDITGQTPTIFRPPGGFYDDASIALLNDMGYKSILWSLDTRDWSMPKSEAIVSKVQGRTECGDIILFHDLEDKRLPTPSALRTIIPNLIKDGYEFVTVSELLKQEA